MHVHVMCKLVIGICIYKQCFTGLFAIILWLGDNDLGLLEAGVYRYLLHKRVTLSDNRRLRSDKVVM